MKEIHRSLSVAVDVLIFTIEDEQMKIMLFQRTKEPFSGVYSLPGVAVREDETLDSAAERAIYERTGLRGIFAEQLYTFGEISRDPRSRTISVAYYAVTNINNIAKEDIGDGAGLFPADDVISGKIPIAFDHRDMVKMGVDRVRSKTGYTDIAFEFVPERFTLPELQRIYEIILCEKLYKANFRKMIAPKVEYTGDMLSGAAHRPSRIYRKADKAERSVE